MPKIILKNHWAYLYLFLCFIITMLACKESPEDKRKRGRERLPDYVKEFRMFYSKARPYLDKLHGCADQLELPDTTVFILKARPSDLLDFEMRTSNIVWYQVSARQYTLEGNPDFKMMDVMPAGLATSAVNIIEDEYERLVKDSMLLVKEAEAHPDSAGLGWFVSSLNLKHTPYAIYIRELRREDTDIRKEEREWGKYIFEGGGIVIAVWLVDLRDCRLMGSYITRVAAEQAWRISKLNDKTPEDEKMKDMKRTIYMTSCQAIAKQVKNDIQAALH